MFTETKRKCDEITRMVRKDGFNALCIHGDKSQPERDWVLQEFRSGNCLILIATDVAARGLGMFGIPHLHSSHLLLSPALLCEGPGMLLCSVGSVCMGRSRSAAPLPFLEKRSRGDATRTLVNKCAPHLLIHSCRSASSAATCMFYVHAWTANLVLHVIRACYTFLLLDYVEL